MGLLTTGVDRRGRRLFPHQQQRRHIAYGSAGNPEFMEQLPQHTEETARAICYLADKFLRSEWRLPLAVNPLLYPSVCWQLEPMANRLHQQVTLAPNKLLRLSITDTSGTLND
jgi:hypothetical protein